MTVTTGKLAGAETITGPVTIGTCNFNGIRGQLWPGHFAGHATLTIRRTLTFNRRSDYSCTLREATAVADKVVANGVTIQPGAIFLLVVFESAKLTPPAAFTIIDNTAVAPIVGRFANLADGFIVRTRKNRFQVSYEGGDGNDLTLTEVTN